MAAESLKQRLPHIPDRLTEQELSAILKALVDGVQGIAAQLDADTGVADTTYLANFSTYIID